VADLPTGSVFPASRFSYAVRDIAGVQLADSCPVPTAVSGATTQNCVVVDTSISTPVFGSNTFPSYTVLNTLNAADPAHGLFAHSSPSAFAICTLTSGSCATGVPPTTTLTATLTGPAGTFANPFSRVQFYWQDPSGRWLFIGTAAVVVTDNTVLNTRTYTFTTVWTPGAVLRPGTPDFSSYVIAVGINSAGSALVTVEQDILLQST
jgi:hypothetical protein